MPNPREPRPRVSKQIPGQPRVQHQSTSGMPNPKRPPKSFWSAQPRVCPENALSVPQNPAVPNPKPWSATQCTESLECPTAVSPEKPLSIKPTHTWFRRCCWNALSSPVHGFDAVLGDVVTSFRCCLEEICAEAGGLRRLDPSLASHSRRRGFYGPEWVAVVDLYPAGADVPKLSTLHLNPNRQATSNTGEATVPPLVV